MEKLLFTSESVTEGHPDKICDQISDAVLDALLAQDPMSRVACETAVTTGLVLVMGEITTKAQIDIQTIVRETIREIGYDRAKYGFDCDTCGVIVALDKQSTDIAMGVDKALEAKENHMSDEEIEAIGAGDQGMMFGYATNETPELMPYPISLAHKLARKLTEVRKNGTLPYLRPDGKTQVSVEYDENGKPCRLEAVVLSTQHDENVSQEQIHEDIKKYVFDEIIPAGYMPLSDAGVRTIVETRVRNDKKAEALMAKFEAGKGKGLQGYAAAVNVPVDSAVVVTFSQDFIMPLRAMEKCLTAQAPYAKQGSLNGPVKGEQGVFVYEVKKVEKSSSSLTPQQLADRYSSIMGARAVSQMALDILKENKDIENNSLTFF